jgi:hypothetical protein
LRRPPSANTAHRCADQTAREAFGLARTELARANFGPLAGHHREAARRRRAHPAVDARAGEGARRGAATAAAAAAAARSAAVPSLSLGVEKKQAPRKGKNEARVWGANGDGVLISRNQRTAVDLNRTVEIGSRGTGLLLAHAGERMRGPGPGCIACGCKRSRERVQGPEGRAVVGHCRGPRAFVRGTVATGLTRGDGPAGLVAKERAVHHFSISRSNFPIEFRRI